MANTVRVVEESASERNRRYITESIQARLDRAKARAEADKAEQQKAQLAQAETYYARQVEKAKSVDDTKREQENQAKLDAVRGALNPQPAQSYNVTVVGGSARQIAEATSGNIRIKDTATGQYKDIVVTREGTMSADAAKPYLRELENQRTRSWQVAAGLSVGQEAARLTGNKFNPGDLGIKPNEYTTRTVEVAEPTKQDLLRPNFPNQTDIFAPTQSRYIAPVQTPEERRQSLLRPNFPLQKDPFYVSPVIRQAQIEREQHDIEVAGNALESYRQKEQQVGKINQYWLDVANDKTQPWAWGGVFGGKPETYQNFEDRGGFGQFSTLAGAQLLGGWQTAPSGLLLIGQKAYTLARIAPLMTKETVITATDEPFLNPDKRGQLVEMFNPLTPRGALTYINVALGAYMFTAAHYSKPVTPQIPKDSQMHVYYSNKQTFEFTKQPPGDFKPPFGGAGQYMSEEQAYANFAHTTETLQPKAAIYAYGRTGVAGRQTSVFQNLQTGETIITATKGAKISTFDIMPGAVGKYGTMSVRTSTSGIFGTVVDTTTRRFMTYPNIQQLGELRQSYTPEERQFGPAKGPDSGEPYSPWLKQSRIKLEAQTVRGEQAVDWLRKVEYKGTVETTSDIYQQTSLKNPTYGTTTETRYLSPLGEYSKPFQTADLRELQGSLKIGKTTYPIGRYEEPSFSFQRVATDAGVQIELKQTVTGFEPGRATTFRTITPSTEVNLQYSTASRLPDYAANFGAGLRAMFSSKKAMLVTPSQQYDTSVGIAPLGEIGTIQPAVTTLPSQVFNIPGGATPIVLLNFPVIQTKTAPVTVGQTSLIPTTKITPMTRTDYRPVFATKITPEEVFRISTPQTSQSSFISQITKVGTSQSSRYVSQTKQIAQVSQAETIFTGSPVPVTTPTNIITPRPMLPGLPSFPDNSGGFLGAPRARQPRKSKIAYMPSLRALTFNIRAPKGFKRKRFIGTGFEVRPK